MKFIILFLLMLAGCPELSRAQTEDTLSTTNQTFLYKHYPEKLVLTDENSTVNPGTILAVMGGISFIVGASQWKAAARGSGDPDYDKINSGSKFMVAGIVGASVGLLWFVFSPDEKKPDRKAYLSLYKSETSLSVGIDLRF